MRVNARTRACVCDDGNDDDDDDDDDGGGGVCMRGLRVARARRGCGGESDGRRARGGAREPREPRGSARFGVGDAADGVRWRASRARGVCVWCAMVVVGRGVRRGRWMTRSGAI